MIDAQKMLTGRFVQFGSIALALGLIVIECVHTLSTDLDQPIKTTSTGSTGQSGSNRPLSARACYQAYVDGKLAVLESAVTRLPGELPEDTHDWNYGNIFHRYMTMSGLLAIGRDNDVEQSKSFLTLNGQTPVSPQIGSFGPNMMLARALLDQGEFECVEKYLEQCKLLWPTGIETLESWQSQVRGHQIPDFGANLFY